MKPTDLVGIPFKKGGNSPDGFDCWGLTSFVFKLYGVDVPSYNHELEDPFNAERLGNIFNFYCSRDWKKIDKPVVPCLVLFKNHPKFVNHAGVYIGNNKFIHCLEKTGVVISDLNHKYWKKKLIGFFVYEPQGKNNKDS